MPTDKPHTLSITLFPAVDFLHVATAFVEKTAVALGLTKPDALALTLATEEIFVYLCRMSMSGSEMEIRCTGGGYFVRADFHLPVEELNLRAFNLTATVSPDDETGLAEMGLFIAARKVLDAFPPPRAALYPSGDAYHLRYRLAEKFGLDPDQILVGNGSNEVISFVIKAFCQPGDNIVTADKTFAVYEWVAEFSGFEARVVPLKEFGFDDEGMLAAIDARTKVVFLCNPNNPTGQYWDETRLRKFLDATDGRQILVIDEAYFEFVDRNDYPNGISLLSEYPNLVVFRTFSKMYALAGLRIGYLAGSREVVDIIRRTCVV